MKLDSGEIAQGNESGELGWFRYDVRFKNAQVKNIAQSETKLGMMDLAILILTLIVLSGLVIDTMTVLPEGISRIIHWMDTAICAVFLVDFVIRFRRAESKRAFLKWGWVDLVASIPNIDILRWGRLLRVLRIIRLLRAIRSVQRVVQFLFRNSTESGFVSIGLTSFLLVVFSSVSILLAEKAADSNIKTPEDAVWWSISTLTTVGYGDRYPVTTEGRVLGMALMTAGVGLFGGLSGLVASMLLGTRSRSSPEQREILERLEQLQRTVEELSGNNSRAAASRGAEGPKPNG
jgi:voltage-gated potassium channel